MVRCPRCGYENDISDIYCRNCTYPLQDPNTNFGSRRKRDKSWNIGTGKKILIVIGIIVIAFLLFSMVYNMTKPTPQSSLNVVTDNESIGDNSYYPYQVNIVCDGSWAGQAGEPNHINYISGTGNKTIRLDCASWDNVTVSIEKVSGSLPLKVQLLRNGKVIAENSTDATGTAVVLNK